jgi:hypothetical protein
VEKLVDRECRSFSKFGQLSAFGARAGDLIPV